MESDTYKRHKPTWPHTARIVNKMYGETEVCFHISVLDLDVRIHKVTICGRDIFHIIDPEIRRAAYEDFIHQFINKTA